MAEDTVQKGKIWFVAGDFDRNEDGTIYVGYEASARFSELGTDYPNIIYSERRGKYMVRRIKTENIGPFINDIPAWMQEICYDTKLYNPYAKI